MQIEIRAIHFFEITRAYSGFTRRRVFDIVSNVQAFSEVKATVADKEAAVHAVVVIETVVSAGVASDTTDSTST
jgi:hypothetical protein